jgi:hypothetical protein
MWVLSIIFAGFLIGLGSLVIRDIPSVDRTITVQDFVDQDAFQAATAERGRLQSSLRSLQRTAEDAVTAQTSARANYNARREAFEAWIATRSATEAVATNPEVIVRARELDQLTEAIEAAEERAETAQQALTARERALSDIRAEITRLQTEARPAFQKAQRGRDLRVFAFRLMLTLPLLLLAGWMVARKRQSAYWPLYRGFVLFALFAFFVELVPYLPSYGGYVRFIVGIAVVMVSGYFLIRQMRAYLVRKQAEEARSEPERRQSIGYETALKKIAAKMCPGCDRSIETREGVNSDYCVHCGIHLQRECSNCGTRNITFHRFCLACGTPNGDVPQTQTA